MSETNIIVKINIPIEVFELGQIFDDYPEVSIQLEQIIPLEPEIMPLVRVSNGDRTAIETTLMDHPQIEIVQSFPIAEDEQLFEVRWSSPINGLVQAMIQSNAWLLEGKGTAEKWEFRLRFPTHEDLTTFNQIVTDNGIPITLRQLYNSAQDEEQSSLSDEQREAIKQAYHHGYFNVPRDSTITNLATAMNISDSAVSQRLRRGLSTLIQQTLMTDETTSESSESAE